jgi:hypothetical protein
MARDHYLPAGLIGSFSEEISGPFRRRRVSVLRRGETRATSARAETIGFINDFYLMGIPNGGSPPYNIDHMWASFEAGLNDALNRLVGKGFIGHEEWLRVLVPFAVGTLCRGPAFADESMAHSAQLNEDGEVELVKTPNDVNFARWMEVPRLLTPVMSCRWVVMHLPEDIPSLTNDIGFAPVLAPDNPVPGIVIPVARSAVLALLPVKRRPVLVKVDGSWVTPIEHASLTPASAANVGVRLARQARRFIVGPTAASVERLADDLAQSDERSASFFEVTGLRHVAMRELIYEWHRLVTAADSDDLDVGPQQAFDWAACQRGWIPPIIMGLGEDTATGIEYRDEQLWLEMPDDAMGSPTGLLPPEDEPPKGARPFRRTIRRLNNRLNSA